MAIMDISIVPLGTGTTGVGRYIVEIHRILKDMGVSHALHDMGTTIEGDVESLFEIARALHEVPFGMGVQRVYTVIKLDDRRDERVHLGEKARRVTEAP